MATFSQADEGFKSGFKVGGGVGYKRHTSKTKAEFVDKTALGIAGDDQDFSKAGRNNAIQFELSFGYEYIYRSFLAGVELDFRYTPSSKGTAFIQTNQAVMAPTEPPFKATLKRAYDFGLSVNLGGLLTNDFALYAIGNVRLGHFKYRFINDKPSVATILSGKKGKNLWGIGARYALKKGYSLALNATYDVYHSLKIRDNLSNGDSLAVKSERPRITNIMLRLVKVF